MEKFHHIYSFQSRYALNLNQYSMNNKLFYTIIMFKSATLLVLLSLSIESLAKVLPTEPSPDSKWAVGSKQTIQYKIDNDDKDTKWDKFSIELMTGPDLYTVCSNFF